MRKQLTLVLVLALCAGLLGGCGQSPTPQAEAEAAADIPIDVDIREKMFVAQTNDVYLNTDEYLGKTIRLEGMFDSQTNTETGETLYMVFRLGPGCCGFDDVCGFEVRWPDGAPETVPEPGAWVEAIGVADRYEEYGVWYLRLDLLRLTEQSVRGAETVLQ